MEALRIVSWILSLELKKDRTVRLHGKAPRIIIHGVIHEESHLCNTTLTIMANKQYLKHVLKQFIH